MTMPHSTPLDRARATARLYRADLAKRDPARSHVLDLAVASAGEHWITDLTTGPEVCTTQEAALIIGVSDVRIRQLIRRNQLPTAARDHLGHLLYVKDVDAYKVTRDRAVAKRSTYEVSSETRRGELSRRQDRTCVVYYARNGARVKIGFSIDVAKRMKALSTEELLATEPGERKLEAERHAQFAALRTHGEWFRLEEPLTTHIAKLRDPRQ